MREREANMERREIGGKIRRESTLPDSFSASESPYGIYAKIRMVLNSRAGALRRLICFNS